MPAGELSRGQAGLGSELSRRGRRSWLVMFPHYSRRVGRRLVRRIQYVVKSGIESEVERVPDRPFRVLGELPGGAVSPARADPWPGTVGSAAVSVGGACSG